MEESELHPKLKLHQKSTVRWNVRGGRRADFLAFGLGKSVIQIETLRIIVEKCGLGKPALIVAPLGVRQEFKRDAKLIDQKITFIRSASEIDNPAGLYLTNYETIREGKIDPTIFCAASLEDRIVPGGLTGRGYQTVYPFHADAIREFTKHGFGYMGMKTIVTDVVRENNQTYRLGWSEQCKDGSKMGVGMPEYLLIFRKNPSDNKRSYADAPVVKLKRKYSRSRWQIDAHGFTRSNGNRLLTPEEIESLPHSAIFKIFRDYSLNQIYDFEHHVHIGEALEHWSVNRGVCNCVQPEKCRHGRLPVTFMLLQPASWHPDVWTDITRMMTLNAAQSAKGREMHLCPMQFDLADRAIAQYTMEGETVLDPFGGLATVAYRAIKLKRKAISIELNKAYTLDGAKYCEAAAREVEMPSLFDVPELIEIAAESPVLAAAGSADDWMRHEDNEE